MPKDNEFPAWARDPSRTREERFAVQLLTENLMGAWRQKHAIEHPWSNERYEREQLAKKERSLNPAYEPAYSDEDLERIAEVVTETKALSFSSWDDRSLRDLSVLRFFPQLKTISCYGAKVTDWSPLRFVPALRELRIGSDAADLRVIGELKELEVLNLWPNCPWPDIHGLERLTKLREFDYRGNILALRAIPRLEGMKKMEVHHGANFTLPLENVRDLPEMPQLTRLFLENTWRLDGIERYPELLNLTVFGYFDDLTPLTALQQLTHLTLSGGYYPTIAPLARLAELRRLVVRRDVPQDYSPLVEAPRLHQLLVELCEINQMEVAALNAGFSSWDEEFAAAIPRPLEPLRLCVGRKHALVQSEIERSNPTARNYAEDHEMSNSEARWFVRECNRRLNALLGKRWGKLSEGGLTYGNEFLEISRPEDLDRLREIVECLRQLLASTRYPWSIYVTADSMAQYERDLDEFDDDEDKEEFNAEREREEWEDQRRRQRERKEYLEREYRYRLLQQEGMEIRPEEFAPKREEKPAEAADADTAPEYDTGVRLSVAGTLTETTFFVNEHDCGLAEMLLETKASSS